MFSRDIKYRFNQFETCLIAFLSDFKKKVNNLMPNCPVYFQSSGDFSYYVGRKFYKIQTKDLYFKTPRIVLKIDDIQFNVSEDTYQKNQIHYQFEGKTYTCLARRKAFNITISIAVVSPSYISMLNHIEAISTIASFENVFTYSFLGNAIHSAYTFQGASNEVPTLDSGSQGSRNVVYTLTTELQVQLWVPDTNSIQLLSAMGTEKIIFDIEQHWQLESEGKIIDLIEYETELIKNGAEEITPIVIDGTKLSQQNPIKNNH